MNEGGGDRGSDLMWIKLLFTCNIACSDGDEDAWAGEELADLLEWSKSIKVDLALYWPVSTDDEEMLVLVTDDTVFVDVDSDDGGGPDSSDCNKEKNTIPFRNLSF